MTSVLIKLYGGLIDNVIFFKNNKSAIIELAEFVKEMNAEKDDAAVFNQNGVIANAKTFLDENDEYIEDALEQLLIQSKNTNPIYIIGNPGHHLGFMVASPDDPLGYSDPVEAVIDLGQMRQDFGNHLKLYEVTPASGPFINGPDLEKRVKDCEIDEFDFSLIEEYVFKNQA